MARIRTIKPEIHSSPSLARCSRDARWVFAGLLTLADDAGRLRDLPKQIAGNLFPLDEDVTIEMVVGWLNELEAVGCIVRYDAEGSAYIYLPGWDAHQRISKPSKSRIPPPPGIPAESPRIPAETQGEDDQVPAETQGEDSDSPAASLLEVEVGSRNSERELGKNCAVNLQGASSPAPDLLLDPILDRDRSRRTPFGPDPAYATPEPRYR
jgi:hypothetical protein